MACKVCAVGRAISTPDVDRSCRPLSSVERPSSTLVDARGVIFRDVVEWSSAPSIVLDGA
jgi:hypothetical protein